jgi:hypothetical protein
MTIGNFQTLQIYGMFFMLGRRAYFVLVLGDTIECCALLPAVALHGQNNPD